ncbi:transcriptional regulator [Longimycelium tulufanense]|uniref:Transcriptional regulator n=1 Tax=Longimycelium tulufanense TaxID=907463 RepID=A0A8J3CAF2_9PSEU|nr:DUF5919 domain-containing protein [Longimycelium tulufanense]GGM64604.1 transcriptional regulator [Longimycelium tulufanense]
MRNERLRDALLRNGFTPTDVALAIRVDAKTVERWITKGRTPYPKHRHALAAMLRESESYLWPDAVAPEHAAQVSESEVIRIYPHRNSVPVEVWDRLIDAAAKRVDVLVHAALFLVERPAFIKELRRKAEAGSGIRLCFGDPASREVARRSEEEGLGKGTLAARIRNALAFYRPLQGVAGVEMRFHRSTLYNSIFRFDNEMIVNTHVYGIQGAHAPALHLRRLSIGSLFETYSECFDAVWTSARSATF